MNFICNLWFVIFKPSQEDEKEKDLVFDDGMKLIAVTVVQPLRAAASLCARRINSTQRPESSGQKYLTLKCKLECLSLVHLNRRSCEFVIIVYG